MSILRKTIWIILISAIVLSLSRFHVSGQSLSDIEKEAQRLNQKVQGTTNLEGLTDAYRDAMRLMETAGMRTGGNLPVSMYPADDPEKEMERRREIINFQHKQTRNILGSLSAGTEKPQIVEAFPVEGYIVVDGGERELFYNELKTDLYYSIKENFVGNLLATKTWDSAKGKFEKAQNYDIESLSQKIHVAGIAGKKCIRRSHYSRSSCTAWAHFLRYEIAKDERYPNFSAQVISATSTDNDQIEIKANAPAVTFFGDDGKTNLRMGCFEAVWILDEREMHRLLKQGEITLRKDIGRAMGPSPGCRPGSTMTLHLRMTKKPVEECKDPKSVELTIVRPAENDKYVFSKADIPGGHANQLTMDLEAKTNPEHYADSVEWIIPDIDGSNRTINPGSTLSSPKGRKFKVVYTGLPENNDQFGKRTVTATLMMDSCKIVKNKEVRFFYPRDEKNNPQGKYPNWYYYWRQTPAARPFGQNATIKYHCEGIPIDKCVCLQNGVVGQYNPYHSDYKAINVCDLKTNSANPDTFLIKLPAVKRSLPSTLSQTNFFQYTFIDSFAIAIMHEFTHFNNFHTFWPHGWNETEDRDEDDIPDRLEAGMNFNPEKKQTYWQGIELGGDEEFLALESTYDYQPGTFDMYDWAKPGKNWP